MTSAGDAARIATEMFGAVRHCERFSTGLRNWVYDITLQSGQAIVLKFCGPEDRAGLAGTVFWTDLLDEAGVPVAKVLRHNLDGAQPHLVLERLPGTDLGNVFDELSETELDGVAGSVARWQQLTQSSLPRAAGFGFVTDYSEPLKATWADLLHSQLDRAEREIRVAGVVTAQSLEPVREWVESAAPELAEAQPLAFLHDATTKNVLVNDGKTSGLVDVDQMAFGDPLYIAALTRMSLLAASRPTRYADQLASALTQDAGLLDLYTAVHCIGFLAELGQRHNQDQAAPVDPKHRNHLIAVLSGLLG